MHITAGYWPFSPVWCVFYQTCDVLACSVSILHLMFISVGRYRGIRRPLRHRTDAETSVLWKVITTFQSWAFLWDGSTNLALLQGLHKFYALIKNVPVCFR